MPVAVRLSSPLLSLRLLSGSLSPSHCHCHCHCHCHWHCHWYRVLSTMVPGYPGTRVGRLIQTMPAMLGCILVALAESQLKILAPLHTWSYSVADNSYMLEGAQCPARRDRCLPHHHPRRAARKAMRVMAVSVMAVSVMAVTCVCWAQRTVSSMPKGATRC